MSNESSSELRRILDSFSSSFTALDLLDATLDDFRVHVVQYRLDEQTLKDWQKFLGDEEPTWAIMKSFLTKQWRTLDSVPANQRQKAPDKSSNSKPSASKSFAGTSSASSPSCVLCKESHHLYQCQKFQSMPVKDRFNLVTEKGLCRNCLSPSRMQRNCTSKNVCRQCKRNHHSLLHFEKAAAPEQQQQQQTRQPPPRLNVNSAPFNPVQPPHLSYSSTESSQSTFHSVPMKSFTSNTEALLSTVCFLVLGADGTWRPCRALLDSVSQSNYITTSLAQELGINLISARVPVIGVNGQASIVKKRTNVIYSSNYSKFFGDIDCLVFDDITGILPNRQIDISRLKIPSHIVLADPNFHIPSKVDMLLGTGMYHEVLLGNIIAQQDMPHLLETKFGWTVGGNFPVPSSSASYISCFTQFPSSGFEELDAKLDKFMEVENSGMTKKIHSPEERHCVKVHDETTTRDETGR